MRRLAFLLALALVLALGASVASHAADAAGPEDYAYGWPVETSGEKDYFELMLPLDVYRTAIHESLWDVAVFNAAGEPVPRFVDQPEPVERRASQRLRLVLPLWKDPARPGGELRLRVVRGPSNEIVELGSTARDDDGGDRRLGGYVVDARSLVEAPARLSLEWEPIDETFLGQLTIEAGDDLTTWRRVGRGAIAGLRQGDELLIQREVTFVPGKADFYRLTWTDLPAAWRLTHVDAIVAAEWLHPIERRRLELRPERRETDEPQASGQLTRLFDAGGHLIVEAVQVDLQTENSMARARVFSGPAPDGPWRLRHDGVVYRLGGEGDSVFNDPQPIGAVRARYWRVVLNGVAPTESVALGLTWRPDRLGFLAQGPAPYRVLAGSTKERSAGYPLQQRYADPALKSFRHSDSLPESRVGAARLGDRVTVSGASALAPAPRKLPWKTVALWVVLVAAVLLVAWMALTLGRQLRSPS